MGGNQAQIAPSSAKAEELKKELAKFGLEFLAEDLAKIKDIGRLVNGIFGRSILASLAMNDGNLDKDDLVSQAKAAFENFGKFRAALLEKLQELEKVGFANTKQSGRLETFAEAFRFAMDKIGMAYLEETDYARAVANLRMDCDLSTVLFIQLGRECGLELIGVIRPKHYLAAYRENGAVEKHIETTMLYSSKEIGLLLSRAAEMKNDVVEKEIRLKKMEKLIETYAKLGYKEFQTLSDDWKSQSQVQKGKVDSLKQKLQKFPYDIRKYDRAKKKFIKEHEKGGIYTVKEWITKEGADFTYDEAQETLPMRVARLERELKEGKSELNKEVNAFIQNHKWYRRISQEEYNIITEHLREKWGKNKESMDGFKALFDWIKEASGFIPFYHVDNEKDLFKLYNQGIELFGKETLEKEGIDLPGWKKLVNPYDWHESKKE